MRILIGYGYFPGTTGTYFERSAARTYDCHYVGTPWGAKTGYEANVDLVELARQSEVKPHLYLFVDSGHKFHFPRGLEKLDCPTACYMIDVHVGMKLRIKQAAFFDYVFSAQKDQIPAIARALGHDRVYWLPLACDPLVHRNLDQPKIYDVGFVGGIGGQYTERREMLDALVRQYKMNDFRRPYTGEEMALIYSQSKIVFNKSVLSDLNMRVFEAMSCGPMLLTDRIGNGQDELFQDRQHVVTYANKQEMLELVEYYLSHEDEREKIANAGHQLVVTDHTYDARLKRILDTVLGNGAPCLEAPIRNRPPAEVQLAYAEIYSMLRLLDATMDQVTALRRLGTSRTRAVQQLLSCLFRRVKYG